jgi:hypothetical protein
MVFATRYDYKRVVGGNRGMNIQKMSLKSLTDLSERELSSLSHNELSKVVSRLSQVANKRLTRLSKSGVFSSAYEGFRRRGEGRFTTKNKTDFDLKKEFLRVKDFLNMETSTIHGAQSVRREVIQKLKKEHNIKITNKQYNDFFKVYERLKEVDSTVSNKLMKYNVFEEISNVLDDSNIDETVDKMRNRLTEIYQKSVGDTERDISEFFRIE